MESWSNGLRVTGFVIKSKLVLGWQTWQEGGEHKVNVSLFLFNFTLGFAE